MNENDDRNSTPLVIIFGETTPQDFTKSTKALLCNNTITTIHHLYFILHWLLWIRAHQ